MRNYSQGEHSFLLNNGFTAWQHAQFFSSQYWAQTGCQTRVAVGRGSTCLFSFQQQDFALRHYHRGGALASLRGDRFIYCGLKNSRPWREWSLLDTLYQRGLPVPKPIAAHVHRRGVCYQADIITQLIPNSQPLSQCLAEAPLPLPFWQHLGETLARFHRHGVYHADLNAHNILVDAAGKVWLIDFDKCALRAVTRRWQQQNIHRLQRSLEKLRRTTGVHTPSASLWQAFLHSYTQSL
jgi:3-deoxy-D-manno-octulosonic acid kinase